eukprot:TRINITY_DN2993_c2_g1_i1.p1 TRINITY_DN2993_c2_g1~~TRINITY_DN2993_c2_g1_i1.p1  ORF type:complete len:392 (-),score=89.29 TRINITY_DN2993_c2_g1_i1:14-1117(-)
MNARTTRTSTNSTKMHGLLGGQFRWAQPQIVNRCAQKSRPEYTDFSAHEYRDVDTVLEAKIKLLAELIRGSRCCVAYTGAGLSVASGLDDYATKSPDSLASRPHVSAERGSGYLAHPNNGHKVLARLFAHGLIKKCVNQNHDGLLQKAGFPQHGINEIHGGWFDPSNPGGNQLRDDLFAELLRLEGETDLCLALGSSLSGLNADRLATTPASKYRKKQQGHGLVIVTLQETRLDDICTLRIFAPLEHVMSQLALELQLPEQHQTTTTHSTGDVYVLPYDPTSGKPSATRTCTLDLSEGSRIRVTSGNYAGCEATVGSRNSQGHYNLQVFVPTEFDASIIIPNDHLLGSWWLHEASQQLLPLLPVLPL